IMDGGHRRFDKEFYRHVERFDQFINISSIAKIKELGSHYKVDIKSLDDFQKALRIAFEEGVSYEMVGVKSGLKYNRIIKYDNIPKDQALSIFEKLKQQESVSKIEIKAIQDYMMHRVLDLADEYKLPVQIHTGLLSGNGNYITNSKPTHLTNLFMEYPQVNFCLFHSSYPYGAELSVLAKSFPNVFIDMTWSAVISPAYSIRFLDEWLETVPANKIMAFGGDYSIVELSYAHSVFARRIVSKVLIGKVRSGYLSEEEAKYVAKKILRDNALEIFKLKGHSRGLKNIEALNRPGRLHDWWVIHNSPKGIIHDWKIIGPFPFGSGLDEIYPPEEELDFDKSYDGMDRTVTWRSVKTGESGYLNFVAMYSENNYDLVAMAYAYTEVISPDERDITLTLGSNDGAKVWINGKVIYNLHTARG
ncbi:MAG: amidohydrolase family protein, partial [Cyclobacteriaceae bacterium]|nr:amidohydrolase family protein [Cyclobacteriaceae bacterium]